MTQPTIYYHTPETSATYAVIKQMFDSHDKAMCERQSMLRRVCGLKRIKDGYGIIYWGRVKWGIQAPDGANPPRPWRLKTIRGSYETYWGPDLKTKEGKALKKEMESKRYQVESPGSIGGAVGIKPVFIGYAMYSPGFRLVPGGCIINCVKGMKVPKDCKRISDIQAEKLTTNRKGK